MRPTHRRLVTGIGIATVALAAVVVTGVLSLTRNRAHQVSVAEARRRLPSSTPASGGARRPAAGVYEYRGSGTESLSLPPLSQGQGPTIPGTVVLLDKGCWRFRVDYSTNHWQDWTYCPAGRDLMESGGQSWQRWMIGPQAITNLSDSHCDARTVALPAERTPGQVWSASCSGTNETVRGVAASSGSYRFVGDEDLTVGATRLRAAHFVRAREMTGAQQGTERSDVWFAVDTGLPVRNRRSIRVRTDTPVGASTYTETGEFDLVAASPTAP